MTPGDFQLWISIGTGLMSLGTAVYVVLTATSRDNSNAIKKIDERLLAVEARAARVEAEMRHLPDRDITHLLEKAIVELKGQISVMDERLKPVAEMAHRVHERMFEEQRK
ncbi:hypothetical protein OSH11_21625 [Kaistia dalseonensis]|uniref:DUF2730 family protein n=1 Tax=Kaistia dalseonensis TaxID=410840 RepID=A0ABU0HEP4_9HYPH|nr:hypothetical protein [Kaistia dalseonensis]MCX5497312.1 hypothetical protein [Kaistia dalseonensis]MDQ0439949.1 hypothetical protein [Kaistia dalseonensis]